MQLRPREYREAYEGQPSRFHFLKTLSCLGLYLYDKHHNQNKMGRKGFILDYSCNQQTLKVGTQRLELIRDHRGMVVRGHEGIMLLACSVSFLLQLRTTCQGPAPATAGSPSAQSLIREIQHRLTHGSIC